VGGIIFLIGEDLVLEPMHRDPTIKIYNIVFPAHFDNRDRGTKCCVTALFISFSSSQCAGNFSCNCILVVFSVYVSLQKDGRDLDLGWHSCSSVGIWILVGILALLPGSGSWLVFLLFCRDLDLGWHSCSSAVFLLSTPT
jgi:hypothetical protein